eukprot:992325-Pyramimonas_sp.AAC.2
MGARLPLRAVIMRTLHQLCRRVPPQEISKCPPVEPMDALRELKRSLRSERSDALVPPHPRPLGSCASQNGKPNTALTRNKQMTTTT